ncbi:MAG: hypothetical protein QOG62_1127 [Thermoleophilaceae bacterium]|jgi:2',3'-cyclic-nucleotide 2'-phosphodiesterase (5'-nucleotidase family)|nr:hypothetical protein [Thermoleophilaceae bacterium]
MEGLRRHLTYANVMVTILAFVVLGGGAYAVTAAKRNSVVSKSIKAGAVRNGDINDNAVTGSKVADDSLTGADLNEATLSEVLRCPGGFKRIQDVCYEPTSRTGTWDSASSDCPGDGLRLPDGGEALLIEVAEPGNNMLWTVDSTSTGGASGIRTDVIGGTPQLISQAIGVPSPYRCVTSPGA